MSLQKFVPLPQQKLGSPEKAFAYINEATSPEQRRARKAECFVIIYGAGPQRLSTLFPQSPFTKA